MNATNLVLTLLIITALVTMFHDSYDRLRTVGKHQKVIGQIKFSLWLLVSGALVVGVPVALEYLEGKNFMGTVIGFALALVVVRWLFRAVTVAAFGVTRDQIALAQADAAEIDPER